MPTNNQLLKQIADEGGKLTNNQLLQIIAQMTYTGGVSNTEDILKDFTVTNYQELRVLDAAEATSVDVANFLSTLVIDLKKAFDNEG